MSVDELKAVVDNASQEERDFLAAYLRVKSDDGTLARELAEANRRMEAGQYMDFEDVKKMLESEHKSES